MAEVVAKPIVIDVGETPPARAGVTVASRQHGYGRREEESAIGTVDLCKYCSVPIQGTLYATDFDYEYACEICADVVEQQCGDEFDPDSVELPSVLPAGVEPAVLLRVLGLTRPCWRCAKPTTCLVGLYPAEPGPGYIGVFTTQDETTMRLAVRLAKASGHAALAASVKPRFSKTLGASYLANGCSHCDALQGNFPLQEDVMAAVSSGNVDGLETLFVAACPTLEWQSLVHDPGAAVIGI